MINPLFFTVRFNWSSLNPVNWWHDITNAGKSITTSAVEKIMEWVAYQVINAFLWVVNGILQGFADAVSQIIYSIAGSVSGLGFMGLPVFTLVLLLVIVIIVAVARALIDLL